MAELYVGLMSGTSLDGIDAALAEFDNGVRLHAFHYQPFPAELRARLQQISQAGQPVSLLEYGHLDSLLGRLFADAVLAVLSQADVAPSAVAAIGSHGQTVYHAPDGEDGFSLQIGDPNRIAVLTGITTVADFRRRDIALGGQGAPLVPAFHRALFAADQPVSIVNIGGIANVTLLDGESAWGFDTGPGNTLLDAWCRRHTGQAFDRSGDWAQSGRCLPQLLNKLKSDAYFRLPPPKSTGKEYFSMDWLEAILSTLPAYAAGDVQATLCQLSADSIAEAILEYAPRSSRLWVCGGGVHNRHLLALLAERLPMPVTSTRNMGVDPDHVEALAFAWLARQTLLGLPGNLCSATGARAPAVLGGIYPGNSGLS